MGPHESARYRIPDSIRKALLTGVSAVLMTEEGIRNVLGDMRLPKDAASPEKVAKRILEAYMEGHSGLLDLT